MPTTTGKGFRIPLDTDPAADGALAVRNLGTDINDTVGRHAAGSVNVNVTAAAQGDAAVAFPVGRFNVAPVLIPTVVGNNAYYAIRVASGLTTTGGNVRVCHRDGTSATATIQVDWVAVQL